MSEGSHCPKQPAFPVVGHQKPQIESVFALHLENGSLFDEYRIAKTEFQK